MQLHDPNFHQKLIEMCDCYLDTDFSAQLREAAGATGQDPEAEALKYLALALLHALSEKADKLSFKRKNGEISVALKSEGTKEPLPPPSGALFAEIVTLMRAILHSEEKKVEMPLSLGLRSGEVEVQVKVAREEGKESLKFKFPQ